ncbi:MAG TPA: hypothetical protein VHH73_11455, partial [Verrucomicrobiae bacterium]|nr:hypothetical protein [Verrucomicrobiae bacterium]
PATDAAIKLMKAMLRRGFILLPEGEHSNVISFTPPLTIPERGLVQAVRALEQELEKLARPSRTSKRVEEKIGRAA